MPKQPVKVYLSFPQRNLLAEIARAEETSRSEVLRNALLQYVYDKNKASNRLKKPDRVSEQ